MTPSRRDFLRQVSAATAIGLMHQLPGRELLALAPAEVIPEPDETLLRKLALAGVDAARSAGAGFTDIRVSGRRGFSFGCSFRRSGASNIVPPPPPSLALGTDYGIRVLVNGAWGFARGQTTTLEAAAQAARTAVARAKANRPRRPRTVEMAPTPRVENAKWAPPIEQDPFAVPLADQVELAMAAIAAAEQVLGTSYAGLRFSWSQRVDVFASSEGSLIVQRIPWASLPASALGRSQPDHAYREESVPALRSGWYGYEAVTGIDLVSEMRQAAERAVAASAPPTPAPPAHSAEVGRYDLVLGGSAVAGLIRETLAPALNLERVLGYRANHEGTSFAAPPAEMLDKYQIASPLVNLRADRTRPHSQRSVGWDDEGVPAGEHALIVDGVIVDYLTSRQTAMELSSLYEARGDAVRSHGCMVATGKARQQSRPEIGTPNLTLLPAREQVSVDDLIADTSRGFFAPSCSGVSDQQLLSGQFSAWDGRVREIRDGKLGRHIKDFAFQFLTPQFWKNVDALGGADTTVQVGAVQAVAARVREVNVLNTGRKL